MDDTKAMKIQAETMTIAEFLKTYRLVNLGSAEHLAKADRLLCYGSVPENFNADTQGDISTLLAARPEDAVRALVAVGMDPERAPITVKYLHELVDDHELAFASQQPDA